MRLSLGKRNIYFNLSDSPIELEVLFTWGNPIVHEVVLPDGSTHPCTTREENKIEHFFIPQELYSRLKEPVITPRRQPTWNEVLEKSKCIKKRKRKT